MANRYDSSDNADYDIVIAGGGMIGTSLALSLSTLPLTIAVVEPVPGSAGSQPSFDDRSTALSRSSQRLYAALGLWSDIEAAATPIADIHVSDKGRFGFARIEAVEQGVEALGYVVINRVLGEVLKAALQRAAGVRVFNPARVASAGTTDGAIDVGVDADGGGRQVIRGRLLVAADGARSAVRDMLEIDSRHDDYGQRAIIGNLQPDKPHRNRAYERFTGEGAIAMLPAANDRMAFVWVVERERAAVLADYSDEEFLAALQADFGTRLGALTRVGERSEYPLWLSRASRLTAPRGVLVGNAAHGLHPVAAQGFNLGLRDVAALADLVADAIESGDGDPGSADLLARYAEWRRDDQAKLLRFTDGLVRLFGSRRPPVRTLRNVGMLGFDLVPGVRRLFARHTMGLAGRLPRLSRGVPLT